MTDKSDNHRQLGEEVAAFVMKRSRDLDLTPADCLKCLATTLVALTASLATKGRKAHAMTHLVAAVASDAVTLLTVSEDEDEGDDE
jgi:hypothetical protein